MDDFLTLGWRAYPATLLIVGGLMLSVWNFALWRRARKHAVDPERALLIARGFRVGIMGLCAVTFGAGWIYGIGWLAVVSLIVFGEEMLETSVMISALRADPARGV